MTKRFDHQKKGITSDKKKGERVQQLRFDYWKEIEGIEAKDLIFLDKSGCNLALTPMYARMWSESLWK